MIPEVTLAMVLDAQMRIERCWATARRMRADGISEPTIEAYATKCIGHVLACQTQPESGGAAEQWAKE